MSAKPIGPLAADLAPIVERFEAGDLKGCCAATYENPTVRWLLGDRLHPGGTRLTSRLLDLIEAGPDDRLLDVASGAGTSAILAARRGCEVVGVDLGPGAVAEAGARAGEEGLSDRVRFVEGDAESLPFADATFDAAICECSLCTFPDKRRAVGEIRRVLRPGGRLALSDVVADHARLPDTLRGAMATIACVGSALSRQGYEELLEAAGFELVAAETADSEVASTIELVRDRLRGARVLGVDSLVPGPVGVEEAIALCAEAARASRDGALGYLLLAGRLAVDEPADPPITTRPGPA